MLAFVNGMQRLTEGTGQPGNVLVLADGATDEVFSNLTVRPTWATSRTSRPCVRENGTAAGQPRDLPGRQPADPQRRPGQAQAAVPAAPRHRRSRAARRRSTAWNCCRAASGSPRPACSKLTGELGEAAGARHGRSRPCSAKGVARELARDRTPEQLAAARNRERLDVGDTVHARRPHVDRRRASWQSSGSTFNSEVWAQAVADRPAVRQGQLHLAGRPHGRRRRRPPQFSEFLKREVLRRPPWPAAGRNRVLRQPLRDQPAVPLRHRLRDGRDGDRRRVRRDEHDVRRHQPADQGHRRAAAAGLFARGRSSSRSSWNRC